jgi:uncharacterized protein (DUF952 family)
VSLCPIFGYEPGVSRRCYHIASQEERQRYASASSITPASLESEGFIHCSFPDQLTFVLGSFFRGRSDLVLLEFATNELELLEVDAVPEASEYFPHVYEPIPWSRVKREFPLSVPDAGAVTLPTEIERGNEARVARLRELENAFAWSNHVEGMRFVETSRNLARTCGHYWFVRGSMSVFHRVANCDEL